MFDSEILSVKLGRQVKDDQDVTKAGCINAVASPSGIGIGALGMLIEISSSLPIKVVVCLTMSASGLFLTSLTKFHTGMGSLVNSQSDAPLSKPPKLRKS